MFYAIDGNYVSNQKDKKRDLEDFPLTMGAGYWVRDNGDQWDYDLCGYVRDESRIRSQQ